MQLTLNDLRKTYLLPAPLLHRRGQGKPKTKQALAGVSITLGPEMCIRDRLWGGQPSYSRRIMF